MVTLKTFIQRGKIIESTHNAKCLVKDSTNKILFSTDNNKDFIFPRSSIKIFQAVPFMTSGASEMFNLNSKNIAISCASHCGESQHISVLKNWLKKSKISLKDLKCGSHNPININSSNKLLLSGKLPTTLHNNCAGKHLAMISGCLANKMSFNNYIDYNHPYQKLIRNSLEYFMGSSIHNNSIGIDGCGAPQYAFTIDCLANAMINLIKEPNH